jgi:hypothetical protein
MGGRCGASMTARSVPAPVRRGDRPVENLCPHDSAEAAVGQILERDALIVPELFDCVDGRPAGFGLPLLELVDCALCQADTKPKLALAPAEHRARDAHFRSKGPPLERDQIE